MTDPTEFAQQDILFHAATAEFYDCTVTREYGIYHRHFLHPFLDAAARERVGHVLDVGCGTGVVTFALAERGFAVTAIDHSPAMLEIARAKAEDLGLGDRITFVTGDVANLRFDDQAFDGVTCQGVLHHLQDLDRCVREMWRVLKPGGFIFLSDPCSDITPLKKVLNLALWMGSLLKHRFGRRGPSRDALIPETVEAPISSSRVRAALDSCEFDHEEVFQTHLPRLFPLVPDRARLVLTRLLSAPWRSSRGDLLFVFGRRPHEAGSGRAPSAARNARASDPHRR